jgi:hypothetical protein
VNVGCSELALYCDDDALVFKSAHGTGTSLPLVLRLLIAACELSLSVEVADVWLEFNESNAKSIRPVAGLIITS